MKCLEWVEKELRLYYENDSFIRDIKDRLTELETDIRYPSVYVDDVLGRICFYVPQVEDEAIRREEARESLQKALARLERDYAALSHAIENLTGEERDSLHTWYYGKGSSNLKTLYKAFRRFRMHVLLQREQVRRQQEINFKAQIIKENSLENTPKGRKILAMV
jgi:hypothetical protein